MKFCWSSWKVFLNENCARFHLFDHFQCKNIWIMKHIQELATHVVETLNHHHEKSRLWRLQAKLVEWIS